jgi:hypothetical protein
VQDIMIKFIVVPLFAVLGIYIVGTLIEDLFGIPEAAKVLFWAVGGISFFALYFRALLK